MNEMKIDNFYDDLLNLIYKFEKENDCKIDHISIIRTPIKGRSIGAKIRYNGITATLEKTIEP